MRATRRVVLTRSPEDNAAMRSALGRIDAELVELPVLTTERLQIDPVIRQRLEGGEYRTIVFVSRSGVEHLLAQVDARPPETVLAIGPGTEQALVRRGWPVTGRPSEAQARVFATEVDRLVPRDGRVLYVRAEGGRTETTSALRQGGWQLDEAPVYRTRPLPQQALSVEQRPTLVVFASPSAAEYFHARQPPPLQFEALAIGPSTAEACEKFGWPTRQADDATVEALAHSVRDWVSST